MNHKSHSKVLSIALYIALISLLLSSGCANAASAYQTVVYEQSPPADQLTYQNNSTPGLSTGSRILIFGDSLSAAYRMDERQGWVALLADRIADKQLPFSVINASVSGETTTGGLARLPAVLAANEPDIVVLELGGNDGLRGMPVNSIRENLLQMIDLVESRGATAVLAGIQIPPNYGPRYTEPFARLFEEVAAERDLVFVPFLIDGIPQNPELMQDDGIHPRAEAQSMILDNVWPFLEDLLKSQ
jgi:acyl-CoA thioesterase I